MKKTLIRIRNIILHVLFLAAVFVLSVLFFMRMINHSLPDSAQMMEPSTFPLVYMERGGTAFNCMHGYAREMDVRYIRDSITPLSPDRSIGIQVQAFSSTIDGISYEVLSLDGSTSLENTQVIKTHKENDVVSAQLSLQNQMLMDQEYVLKIKINSGGRELYYYTHVLLSDGLHADDYLNYVSGFYDKTVNRTDLTSVGTAVEPDDTTDQEATLAHMDIHDSVPQLTWGNLHPQIFYKPTPKITEINKNTGSLTMDYRIAAVNDQGITEVFNVKEYYRVRFTDSRVFLLTFERTTDEVFDPENHVLEDTGIRLGITGKDIVYRSDEKNKVIAFVQENELWTFERATSRLTQVFSFPQKENMDSRDFYDAHRIRILDVTENGNVCFTVSGYMNRGAHEGDSGILLYYYDAATDMAEELVFLACDETGKRLFDKVDTLAYLSEDKRYFCVMLEQTLYKVDLSSFTMEEIASDIKENCYCASASGRYFAYLPEGKEYASSKIVVLDLAENVSREISCGKKEYLRPLCFMKDDLVYGVAKKKNVSAATLSSGYFPMSSLIIEDSEGSRVKEYHQENTYITGVVRSDRMLTLQRAVKNANGTFTETVPDEIMDMTAEDDASLGSATKYDKRKQTVVYLRVGSQIEDTSPDVVRSKIINSSLPRLVRVPTQVERQQLYYVYALGSLKEVYVRPNMAVALADENVGVVVDTEQRYIWVRGYRNTTAKIPLERVPDAMKNGVSDAGELQKALKEDIVLDLSGCSLDQVLYYVSHGMPVAAQTANGPVTIVGYDEYNTYLLNPGESEWYYYGMNDSTEMFENAGNRFMTAVKGK